MEYVKAIDEALLLIKAIHNELRMGTKHFDARDPSVEITDVRQILSTLVDGQLVIEPVPERRQVFDGYVK